MIAPHPLVEIDLIVEQFRVGLMVTHHGRSDPPWPIFVQMFSEKRPFGQQVPDAPPIRASDTFLIVFYPSICQAFVNPWQVSIYDIEWL